jgi:hypothetical protein
MSNVILVLQKVTTFPIETIVFPTLLDSTNDEIHQYYSKKILLEPPIRPKSLTTPNPANPATPANPASSISKTSNTGTVSEDEISKISKLKDKKDKTKDEKEQTNANIANKPSKENEKLKRKEETTYIDKLKKRFIVYNAIFDKLLANNLNLLQRDPNDITTLVIFPIYDQLDNGRIELKKEAKEFYYDKFDNITRQTLVFKNNIGYYGLPVFRSEKNDEYKKAIKDEFDDIKRLVTEYNNDIIKKTQFGRSDTNLKQIKQILFIIDTDKKSLFTGFYNKPLGKEKEEILNKEYSNFLSSATFRRKNVDDAGINLLYRDVKKEMERFNNDTEIGINEMLSEETFNVFISELRKGYKKNTDAEYKKSIELKDNIKDFKIYYKVELADKIIEDKIETGSNKLYYIYLDKSEDNKQHVIGYFTVNSEERQIYRFQEDNDTYNSRIKSQKKEEAKKNTENPLKVSNGKKTSTNLSDTKLPDTTLPNTKLPDTKLDFAVQISKNYGTFTYKNLNETITSPLIKYGFITQYRDKKEKKYKFFNIRDIDQSLLNKDSIRYYSDILFDKKTLIEYLKSKEKYTEKTSLSYEFLKINDSPELSKYCDFIYKNFKSNINSLKTGFFGFDPFKIKFNDDVIMKNIMDIIFESNTQIYVQNNRVIKEEARKESRQAYKIVKYRMDDKFDDENCKKYTDIFLSNKEYKDTKEKNDKINECLDTYEKEKNPDPSEPSAQPKQVKSVVLVVSKLNIKDVGLLQSTVECKTKSDKIKYDYRQLFSNITKRIRIGGTKKKYKNVTRKINSKRRLKAKRYK